MNTKKIPIFLVFFKEEITKKLSLMTKKKEREKINRAIHMNNAMNIKKCPNYFSFFTICGMPWVIYFVSSKKIGCVDFFDVFF